MARTVVEPDGRILVPADVLAAAHIQPGQELEFVASEGHLVFNALDSNQRLETCETEQEFLASLERALDDVRAGRVTRQRTDSEFLSALDNAN